MSLRHDPDQLITSWVAESVGAGGPDYLSEVLAMVERTPQHRWAKWFPGAWTMAPAKAPIARHRVLPVSGVRIVAMAALLLLALALGAVFIAGSRPRLPAPFGPAANGHVAYAAAGDIYTADPVTGVATAVITGPDIDSWPSFSRDGTHIAFQRQAAGGATAGRLYVARADGTNVVAITPDPMPNIQFHSFSPDGRTVVFASGVYDGDHTDSLWLANTDGSGLRRLEVGVIAADPVFLPPDGSEVLYAGQEPNGPWGLYGVNLADGAIRTIVAPTWFYLGSINASPDGSRIAYSASLESPDNAFRVHVVTQVGSDVTLPMSTGALFEDTPSWSNDGTRLVVSRGYAPDDSDMVLAVVPADGSGPGQETAHGLTGYPDTDNGWAPDDQSILAMPADLNGAPSQQLVLDPATLKTKPAPWTANSLAAWQRAAP